jgi:prepilin-type N-terminal cleavage/methylation domain-containing protein/prepilin-type processing-associated H-X9-DG protein
MLARHRGFTLIELLVVVAVIAVLVGLLAAAVQRARAAAARTQCGNNLKQVGLAAHQFHDAHKCFPAGVRVINRDGMKWSSWLTHLLPYVEQAPLWATTQAAYAQSPSPFVNPPHAALATVIAVFACPTDGRTGQTQTAKREQFPVALTSYLGVSGKDLTSKDGIFFRDSSIAINAITDGTSNTLLAGERPPSADFQYGWWYAGIGQRFTGSGDMVLGVQEQNVLRVTAGSCPPGIYAFAPGSIGNQCDMFHFWSLHAGGAHFLFADGSVRFLAYEAAPLLPALASRAGGEAVGDFLFGGKRTCLPRRAEVLHRFRNQGARCRGNVDHHSAKRYVLEPPSDLFPGSFRHHLPPQ